MSSTVRVESLESRQLLSITVNGSASSDTIRIASDNGSVLVVLNGVESRYTLSDSIVVNAGDGNDSIRLDDASNLPVTIDGGIGDDRIDIGNGDVRAAHLGAVSVVGGSGADSLFIDDSLAATPNTAVSFDNPIDTYVSIVAAPGSEIRSDAATASSSVESITYNGSAFADVVNVRGTNARVALFINGGFGDDSVTVGNDIDSKIRGVVTVDGGGDRNALVFDDSADSFADTYFFGTAGTLGTLRKNSGGATTSFANMAAVSLQAGLAGTAANNQQFRITSLPATAVTIFAGSGDDTMTIGDGVTSIDGMQAGVTFVGQDGTDSIIYNDTIGADAATYEVSPFALTNTGNAAVQFFDCEAINVIANGAANEMRVTQTLDVMNVTLNGGGGDDVFRVGNGDVDTNIASSVMVTGGAGNDSLFINDTTDDVGDDAYAISAGLLLKSLKAILWSTATTDRVEAVSIACSANADVIRVSGATPGIALNIDAGGGDDSILVDRTTDGSGTITAVSITSGTGADTLEVNSDFAGVDAIVALPAIDEDLQTMTIRAGGRVNLGGLDNVTRVRGPLAIDGILDVASATLVASTADLAKLWAIAAAGYAGGTWTGGTATLAITSSMASSTVINDGIAVVTASSVGLPTFGTVVTSAGDVILRYTLAGDANIDRVVNFADLLALAQHYGATSGARWVDGNFDYDAAGTIDFADLLVLAQNYGQQIPAPIVPASARLRSAKVRATI